MSLPPDMPLLILSRRKPHLILIMSLGVLTGVSVLLGGEIDETVPRWIGYTWAGALSISSFFVLLGNLARLDREKGMHVERGALTMQTAAVLAYGFCIMLYSGWHAGPVLSLLASWIWGGINLWEVKLITVDLRMLNVLRDSVARRTDAPDQ